MTSEELLVGQVRALRDRLADPNRIVTHSLDFFEHEDGEWIPMSSGLRSGREEPARACVAGHVYLIQGNDNEDSPLSHTVVEALLADEALATRHRLNTAGGVVGCGTAVLIKDGPEPIVAALDSWLAGKE